VAAMATNLTEWYVQIMRGLDCNYTLHKLYSLLRKDNVV
jgi:hypothetical protein